MFGAHSRQPDPAVMLRLGHVDLHDELQRFKRSILLSTLVMQAPVYAGLIVIFLRLGI